MQFVWKYELVSSFVGSGCVQIYTSRAECISCMVSCPHPFLLAPPTPLFLVIMRRRAAIASPLDLFPCCHAYSVLTHECLGDDEYLPVPSASILDANGPFHAEPRQYLMYLPWRSRIHAGKCFGAVWPFPIDHRRLLCAAVLGNQGIENWEFDGNLRRTAGV